MTRPLFIVLLASASLTSTIRADAESDRYPYQSCFEIAARLHDLPLDVLLAVAATESAWNPDARSDANAHGIMQIQWPSTAHHLGVTRLSALYNPCLNIELGARYLRELLERYDGDMTRALAAYNYGPGRIEEVGALPPGASRYVDRVGVQRARVTRETADIVRRAEQARDSVMTFDHVARARGYAQTLNARVGSAEFAWAEVESGYGVTMQVEPGGLSLADATLLQTLGWPGIAANVPRTNAP